MRYTVGLDIGITSVGWCVINEDKKRIQDLGVRLFNIAENPKTGSSLAEPRRLKRGLRRRLRRSRIRMHKTKSLFVEYNLITNEEINSLYLINKNTLTPWELRNKGLDNALTGAEFARALTHICKRRGYKSMRLSESKDDDEGVVKSSISENKKLMEEKGYRTVGEMFCLDEKFKQSKRNHQNYNNVVSREMLLDEIKTLFETQRKYGSKYADREFEKELIDVFLWQKPVDEGDLLIDKVGLCTFFGTEGEKRAPSRCFTSEKFMILQKINNILIIENNSNRRALNEDERKAIYNKCLTKASNVTYYDIRKLLKLNDTDTFNMVRYVIDKPYEEVEKKEKLPELKGYHALRKAISSFDEKIWSEFKKDDDMLDKIAYVLTYWKSRKGVQEQLKKLNIENELIDILQDIRFDKQKHLSIKAMKKINKYLEEGMIYSKACNAAGFHHSKKDEGAKYFKLPVIPTEDIMNPVVIRALSQTRKVLNAIIGKYGSPDKVMIELARDVAKNKKERDKISKKQAENREKNEIAKKQIEDTYKIIAHGKDIRKYRLWLEQDCKCVYSGNYIDPVRMLTENGYAEIEHIIPYSKSFDSSYNNEVIALGTVNQEKGNRIPFEYLGGNDKVWHEYEERVDSLKIPYRKKQNLLKKNYSNKDEESFKERNLNDTRYITRFLSNYLRDNLITLGSGKDNIITVNGQVTAYLRSRWGLNKDRDENARHHALDAAVLAVSTRSYIQRVSTFLSWKALKKFEDRYVDTDTGEIIDAKYIPEPWEGFRDELTARMSDTPKEYIEKMNLPGYKEDDLEFIRPIFVSRMPIRKTSGALHKETIRRHEGLDDKGKIMSSKKVNLSDVKLSMLESMTGKESDPQLYNRLKARLEEYNDNPKKAFAEPVYKLKKDGSKGPLVRSIRVYDNASSGGVEVNKGIADNGSMIRVDIFEKDKKFYIVPIYTKDVVNKELPNRAIVANKAEANWDTIDNTYSFKFSVYPYDLLEIVKKTKKGTSIKLGYYLSCNRATGSMSLIKHDGTDNKKDGIDASPKTANEVNKYIVDTLGNITKVNNEVRRGFQKYNDIKQGRSFS